MNKKKIKFGQRRLPIKTLTDVLKSSHKKFTPKRIPI